MMWSNVVSSVDAIGYVEFMSKLPRSSYSRFKSFCAITSKEYPKL